MTNILPHKEFGNKGFTLIELLVVIVILAILGVIGVSILGGTQSKARDAKRKADIISMSKAMEVNYKPGTGYSTSVDATWFADQQIPANPAPGGVSYSTGASAMTTSSWIFCAMLENSTGNATGASGTGLGTTTAGNWFCRRNSQ